jgi:metal-responsive CopG/Arc/MetJ family transcriptional regulator
MDSIVKALVREIDAILEEHGVTERPEKIREYAHRMISTVSLEVSHPYNPLLDIEHVKENAL